MSKIDGGCLCGAVRYSSDVEPVAVVNCYCDTCKKNSGSTHSWNLMVPKGSVSFSGEPLKVFEDKSGASGETFERRFCGTCGSHVISGGEAYGDVEFIKAGTLDEGEWAEPALHIWMDEKIGWVYVPDDAQKAAKNPG